MTAPSTMAADEPAARVRSNPRLDHASMQRERESSAPDRRLEHNAVPPEAASFPEALIGVPFN